MNLSVSQGVNLILFSFSLIILSCQSSGLSSDIVSSLDSQYRLKMLEKKNFVSTNSTYINFYKNYLSKTLVTNCPSLPSCSCYSKILFKEGKSFKSILNTVVRVILESDFAYVGTDLVNYEGSLKFVDFPYEY